MGISVQIIVQHFDLTSSRRCPPPPPPPPWRSPRAARRPGHHHRQREVQVPRGPLPAQLPGNGGLRHPRDHLQLHQSATLTSGRTCTPTPSCPEAPPCTPVLLTACRRRSPPWLPPPSRSTLPQRGSTPSGSEAPSWLPSPPSSRCGSPSRSTTSAAHPLSTASASKRNAPSFTLLNNPLQNFNFYISNLAINNEAK